MTRERDNELGEVIVEFIAIGNSVKVSAIHVASGEEVSIVGPTSASEFELKHQVVAKLRYVLNRKKPADKGGIVC